MRPARPEVASDSRRADLRRLDRRKAISRPLARNREESPFISLSLSLSLLPRGCEKTFSRASRFHTSAHRSPLVTALPISMHSLIRCPLRRAIPPVAAP